MKKLSFPTASEDYHEAKKEDLLFMLNQSTAELVSALAETLKPSGANSVILKGCRIIDSSTSVEIEAGFIYHNGEVYRVVASSFVFPGGLGSGVDPLENVWLVPEEQTLPNADRVYRDGRTHRVFRETAMKLSGSATGAFFRLDALSYFANTAPRGTIRLWRPPSGVTLADVCRPNGLGKGEFLGWRLVADSGGRTFLGMNWDESAVDDVRTAVDYQDINEKGGKKQVGLTVGQLPSFAVKGTRGESFTGGGDPTGSTLGRGANNPNEVTFATIGNNEKHENRMPYLMAYFFEKI